MTPTTADILRTMAPEWLGWFGFYQSCPRYYVTLI